MSIKFAHGKKHFEIKQEGEVYAGYVDGVRSVTGPRAHIAARVLIKKHVSGSPEATVLSFPPSDLLNDESEQEPDRAGSAPTELDCG